MNATFYVIFLSALKIDLYILYVSLPKLLVINHNERIERKNKSKYSPTFSSWHYTSLKSTNWNAAISNRMEYLKDRSLQGKPTPQILHTLPHPIPPILSPSRTRTHTHTHARTHSLSLSHTHTCAFASSSLTLAALSFSVNPFRADNALPTTPSYVSWRDFA